MRDGPNNHLALQVAAVAVWLRHVTLSLAGRFAWLGICPFLQLAEAAL